LQVLDLNNTAAFKLVSFSIRTVIAGQIEIKPGSEGHPFVALRSRGAIPVAVISTPGFDAPASLDWSSLRFGRTGEEASLALRGKSREPQCSVTDVNQDGLDDLLCLFETRMTRFLPGDVEGILTARTVGGNLFKAGDFFRSR
jgi:hypothetical protein